MEIIKKIGLALLISIGLVAVAVVLIAPFALIENTYIKMGIAFLFLFGFVLSVICVDDYDCDLNEPQKEPRMSVNIEEEINEFAHDYAKKNFGGDSYEAYAEKEDIANACIAAANWAFGKAPKWMIE